MVEERDGLWVVATWESLGETVRRLRGRDGMQCRYHEVGWAAKVCGLADRARRETARTRKAVEII